MSVEQIEREYVRIQPTGTAPRAGAVTRQLTRLHALTAEREPEGPFAALRSPTSEPVRLEVLLVAPGGPQPRLDYYIGCAPTAQLDAVERHLDGLFPDEFELTRTTLALDDVATTPTEAITFTGVAERRRDWQLRLGTYDEVVAPDSDGAADDPPPLATVAAALAESPTPVIYQALAEPHPDYTSDADLRREDVRKRRDTPLQRWMDFLFGRTDGYRDRGGATRQGGHASHRAGDDAGQSSGHGHPGHPAPPAVRDRLAELEAKDARHGFTVAARAVRFAADTDGDAATAGDTADAGDVPASGTPPDGPATPQASLAARLETAFTHMSGDFHRIEVTSAAPEETWTTLRERTLPAPSYERWYTKLPATTNRSAGIVADPAELPLFTLLSGARLSEPAERALAPTRDDQTPAAGPPSDRLDTYTTGGLTLGRLLDANDEPGQQLALPPALQPLHTAIYGATGAGKSTLVTRAGLDNSQATDGADIFVLPKGAGMAREYLRAHVGAVGDLDDVYYFDCSEWLPATGFFDIRADLAAGVPRATAVSRLIDHYIEILEGLMGADAFWEATAATKAIRYLLRALFDPVHGADAFTHSALDRATQRMRDHETPPAVSDDNLAELLAGLVANDTDVFDNIMQGVLNRIDEVPADRRLAQLFGYVPPDEVATGAAAAPVSTDGGATPTEGPRPGIGTSEAPHLDFEPLLNQDVTILIDTGGLGGEAQRAVTLAVLSQLWRAVQRRARRRRGSVDPDAATATTNDLPLVNLYLEEAATVADTGLLDTLLSQSRGFGLAVTLAMQFPGQMREAAPRTYAELLNNVGTILTGKVGHDPQLARRLSTAETPPDEMATRLRGLRRGQWLAALPAPFDEPAPKPTLLASPTPPEGHPAAATDWSAAREAAFTATYHDCVRRTRERAALTLTPPHQPADAADPATPTAATEDATVDAETADESARRPRVDTPLPYTTRMPAHLSYDAGRHAIQCTECGATYDPDHAGLTRALECHPAGAVDPGDVPITDLTLKLTDAERRATEYTDAQLMFLQAVYNAQQGRYEPPAYDLVTDSMLRLHEYVGVGDQAVDELIDAGLLRHDGDHPHRLYTVTSDGRALLGEQHRKGVAHGHAAGDLGESSQHTMAVEAARRWLTQAYVDAPDSPAVEVVPYYEPAPTELDTPVDGPDPRLDVVATDPAGDIVVAVEVERVNNDLAEAVPSDYDTMAACDPDEAIWITMTQSAGHRVLAALNDPVDGAPRVEKSYADSTPIQQFRLDAPGCTAIYPISWVRKQLES